MATSAALSSVTSMGTGNAGVPAKSNSNARVQKIKDESAAKIARIREFGKRAKENMNVAVAEVVDVAIIDALAFLAALAEGYFGREKITVMKVPVHAGVGALLTLFGLYEAFNGSKNARYYLAAGTGLTAPAIVGLGQDMGRAWAERRPASSGGGATRTVTQTEPAPSSSGTRRVVRR